MLARRSFGKTRDGEPVTHYTLRNARGTCVGLLDYGAIVSELWVPDRDGELGDVVLGFDSLADYENNNTYFGAIIGRVANRIAGAAFEIGGTPYRLASNDGDNHLHGGLRGFDRRVWRAEALPPGEYGAGVRFRLVSEAGDEGYPGRLLVQVDYRLAEDDSLHLCYRAQTDVTTPVNLTNHSYWNLAGEGTVLTHELSVAAEAYLEVDEQLIPSGGVLSVAGTPFDFRSPKPLSRDLGAVPGGYDHNFVLSSHRRAKPEIAAELYHPDSGRSMTVLTTEPGLQLYSGNFLDGLAGKGGRACPQYGGLCLETQGFPDALHHDNFPTVLLSPGQFYRQHTIYRFGVR